MTSLLGVPLTVNGSPRGLLICANHREGEFDEVQDAHMVYPITAHCMKFQRDEDGGFIVEAATVQDPIGFATALSDERGVPLWGTELTEMMRRYRYFTGLLTMVSDENHGQAWIDEHVKFDLAGMFDFAHLPHLTPVLLDPATGEVQGP